MSEVWSIPSRIRFDRCESFSGFSRFIIFKARIRHEIPCWDFFFGGFGVFGWLRDKAWVTLGGVRVAGSVKFCGWTCGLVVGNRVSASKSYGKNLGIAVV
jgi:hypothetical protein